MFSSYGEWPNDRESRAVLSDPSFLATSAATLTCVGRRTDRPFMTDAWRLGCQNADTHGAAFAFLHIQASTDQVRSSARSPLDRWCRLFSDPARAAKSGPASQFGAGVWRDPDFASASTCS